MKTTVKKTVAVLMFTTAVLGGTTGCSNSHDTTKHVPTSKPTPQFDKTNNGAVAISTVNSFVQQFETGSAKTTCAFTSENVQQLIIDTAVQRNLVGVNAKCETAVRKLRTADATPDPITGYTVTHTTKTETDLTFQRETQPDGKAKIEQTKAGYTITYFTPIA